MRGLSQCLPVPSPALGGPLPPWSVSAAGGRIRHLVRVELVLAPVQSQLQAGQEMTWADLEDLGSGRVCSPWLGRYRLLAPSLQDAMARERRQRPGPSS